MTRPARQGEGALSDAIREALSVEPGLLLFRNAQCAVVKSNRMVRGGLGNGSADLVGLLSWRANAESPSTGRFLALEVKAPGEIPHEGTFTRIVCKMPVAAQTIWREIPDADCVLRAFKALSTGDRHVLEQELWLRSARRLGGFAAYVDSVDGARAAIARARTGARE